jgi:hypothetical protein
MQDTEPTRSPRGFRLEYILPAIVVAVPLLAWLATLAFA